MIIQREGNLINSKAQVLGTEVNLKGIINSETSKNIMKEYPNNFQEYSESCKKGKLTTGSCLLVIDEGRVIANIVDRILPEDHSDIVFLQEAFEALLMWMKALGLTTVALPQIGQGNIDLPWNKVEKKLAKILEEYPNVTVEVWTP